MRVVLGRIALLLGVLVVAAMAWYGATALFGDEGSSEDTDDEAPAQRACPAASKREARAAQRTFVEKYGRAPWFSGIGVSDTRLVEEIAANAPPVIGVEVPAIQGEGAILLVSTVADAEVPELPGCLQRVPVVYMANGPFQGD
ncbi:hypothetical protein [Nocardioides bizhenqiangii]|uniref:Uncharacterized protein n=1 Tax=Nocardioides bizhenqiangii TaxID=3095076 RepID=A0ABZ0ZKN1_9ACTN|nr:MULTISPECIES: hypothetical protein [unclassified Nocardioides]MDZ5620254.1 hypothetical protein [Nocardioides sp. HM23]WQQ24630.1 hypothetical protein SHK19_11680 [Nocardioides sp. HM61]